MTVADGEPQLHFLLTFPVAHKKMHHLEGEGQIVKNIYGNKLPGPDGPWVCRGREGGAGVRYGGEAVISPVWLSNG